jgi:hypothetical protein
MPSPPTPAEAGWRWRGGDLNAGEEDFRRPPLFVVAPHTLVLAAKSSGKRAILWLIRPLNDHLRIWKDGLDDVHLGTRPIAEMVAKPIRIITSSRSRATWTTCPTVAKHRALAHILHEPGPAFPSRVWGPGAYTMRHFGRK